MARCGGNSLGRQKVTFFFLGVTSRVQGGRGRRVLRAKGLRGTRTDSLERERSADAPEVDAEGSQFTMVRATEDEPLVFLFFIFL